MYNIQSIKYESSKYYIPKKLNKHPMFSQKSSTCLTPKTNENQTPKLKQQNQNYNSIKLLRHNSSEQLKNKARPSVNTQLLLSHIESGISKAPNFLGLHKQSKLCQISKQEILCNKKRVFLLSPSYSPKTQKTKLKQTSSTTGTSEKTQKLSPQPFPSFIRQKSPPKCQSLNFLNQNISIESFKVLRKIGQGKYGKVYLAKQIKSQVLVALKQINKKKIIEESLLVQFTRELKTQMFLNHPNIIKVYGYFQDKQNFYTIMEYGSDGQLYKKIEKKQTITQQGASFIAKNLLEAVNYLHMNKIIHRDIKPQNIVLIHGNVKVCDFGWAAHSDIQLRSTFCGTPLYLSPQLLIGEKYNQKVDIWAVGILIYQLLLGTSPFDIQQNVDLYKIIKSRIRYPKDKQISEQFKEFMEKILEKSPKKRKSCNQLLQMKFIKRYHEFQTCEQFCK